MTKSYRIDGVNMPLIEKYKVENEDFYTPIDELNELKELGYSRGDRFYKYYYEIPDNLISAENGKVMLDGHVLGMVFNFTDIPTRYTVTIFAGSYIEIGKNSVQPEGLSATLNCIYEEPKPIEVPKEEKPIEPKKPIKFKKPKKWQAYVCFFDAFMFAVLAILNPLSLIGTALFLFSGIWVLKQWKK